MASPVTRWRLGLGHLSSPSRQLWHLASLAAPDPFPARLHQVAGREDR